MSQQHVIRAIRDLELRDAQRADELAEQEEVKRQKDITVFKYMIAYKKEREAVWAEAEARGAEPDELWPHPDDILLFPKTSRWRIRGPFGEANLAYYNWCRAERDYCFAYRILDMTLNKTRHQSWWDIWTLFWGFFDLKLPLRWQQMDKTAVPFFNLSILTDKRLEAHVEHLRREADFLSVLAGIPAQHDKESYKVANTIMKPLLKREGFNSLAEFEHAYETSGKNII